MSGPAHGIFARDACGRVQPILDLSLVAALLKELSVAQAMATLADFERADCFTAYAMRDGRIFFVDPQGLAAGTRPAPVELAA